MRGHYQHGTRRVANFRTHFNQRAFKLIETAAERPVHPGPPPAAVID